MEDKQTTEWYFVTWNEPSGKTFHVIRQEAENNAKPVMAY